MTDELPTGETVQEFKDRRLAEDPTLTREDLRDEIKALRDSILCKEVINPKRVSPTDGRSNPISSLSKMPNGQSRVSYILRRYYEDKVSITNITAEMNTQFTAAGWDQQIRSTSVRAILFRNKAGT